MKTLIHKDPRSAMSLMIVCKEYRNNFTIVSPIRVVIGQDNTMKQWYQLRIAAGSFTSSGDMYHVYDDYLFCKR